MKTIDKIETIVGSAFIAFSLTDIYNILSIIVICLQCLYFLVRACIAIYNRFKNKQYDKIDDEVKDAIDNIQDVLDRKENDDGKK